MVIGLVVVYVGIDSYNRRMRDAPWWVLGSFLLTVIAVPLYFAKRSLKEGEIRSGGLAWNVIKNVAVMWTCLLAYFGFNVAFLSPNTPGGIIIGILFG